MKRYLDKLLEEVDEQQANALRGAELDVIYREGSLKTMREEVEKERRGQDALLRDMRQSASNAEGGNTGGNGSPNGGGIGHSFSNANMQQVHNSGIKAGAGRNSSKR